MFKKVSLLLKIIKLSDMNFLYFKNSVIFFKKKTFFLTIDLWKKP